MTKVSQWMTQQSFTTLLEQEMQRLVAVHLHYQTLHRLRTNSSGQELDLTDGGATVLLPSYTIDVWVTGSDESGNPYDSEGNTAQEPIASWPLALSGPDISLRAADTTWDWSNPTPNPGESVSLSLEAKNNGASGQITFVLQRLVSGDNWETVSSSTVEVSNGKTVNIELDAIARVKWEIH